MNKDQPAAAGNETGVSAWIQVPLIGQASDGLTVNFRVLLQGSDLGFVGGDVTPGRPTGKVVSRGSASVVDGSANGADIDASHFDACCHGLPCAWIGKGNRFFKLSMLPSGDRAGSTYEVELEPLSLSQGWRNGEPGYEGSGEKTGYGSTWCSGHDVILLSLISPVALDVKPVPAPAEESGVFVWMKLVKSLPDAKPPYILETDFSAVFTPRVRTGDNIALPSPPLASDVPAASGGAGRQQLASIDLKGGLWTLYADGAALQPKGASYEVVAGPRSQARAWIDDPANSAWRDDAALFALITLTTCSTPL